MARCARESRERRRKRRKAAAHTRDGNRGPGHWAGDVRGRQKNLQSGPSAGRMGLSDAEHVPGPQDQPDDRQPEGAQFRDRNGTRALRQRLGHRTERLGGIELASAQQGAQRVRRRAQVQFCRWARAVRPRQPDQHSRQRERRIL